jgi:hypothetical protein
MTKEEVISKFCALSSLVGKNVFKNQKASDCFCGALSLSDNNFQFSEDVFQFIESAVKSEISKHQESNC